MIALRVIWVGVKEGKSPGDFVEASSNKVLATGEYGESGYDVLMSDGTITTYNNAALALAEFNKTHRQ